MANGFFHFDLGNLLTILSFIGILYKFHSENTKKINEFEFRVDLMWQEFCKRFGMNPAINPNEQTRSAYSAAKNRRDSGN